jgi:predicted TIM-barrel fold metal-dependent hydrolase
MPDSPVIDCDIHHAWRDPAEVVEYMTPGWREFIKGPGRAGLLPISSPSSFQHPLGGNRDDTFPPGGGPPGSDYELMRQQLLDPARVSAGVLTYGEGLFVDSNPNPFLAAEIARASNEWTREQWLTRDDRLFGSILVSNQDPTRGAAEVRRLGPDPRMVQVLMSVNGLGPAFGHPVFHPIYEAAVEFGLPIAIHAAGHGGNSPSSVADGSASFYIEYHALITQMMMTHLASFIMHGVFEKFPTLRLLLVEGGVAWVPAFLWRLDTEFRNDPAETPWLTRLPSEYFREHVRLTTQPLEFPPDNEQLVTVLEMYDAKDVLLFATDYPHWDTDELDHVSARLPTQWLPQILGGNALTVYSERGLGQTVSTLLHRSTA